MTRRQTMTLLLLVLLAGGTWGALRITQGRARAARIADTHERASQLESDEHFGEAIMVYDAALQGIDLTRVERADFRYQLARVLILGGNLHRALGVLQELTEEDVGDLRIDVTPLYMQLGDRFVEEENPQLAKVAYRLGQSIAVTAPRITEFASRLEQFITPAKSD